MIDIRSEAAFPATSDFRLAWHAAYAANHRRTAYPPAHDEASFGYVIRVALTEI